jgi:hypothetical protein
MQRCIKILLFLILNKAQQVSGATPPIIRSLKLHKHVWQPSTVLCKTRGCLCSFRLLMMGGVSPETCWTLFKIRNNEILLHRCILLDFFFFLLCQLIWKHKRAGQKISWRGVWCCNWRVYTDCDCIRRWAITNCFRRWRKIVDATQVRVITRWRPLWHDG